MGTKPRALETGDRVQLSGGYDFNPKWLSGGNCVQGTVVDFIPGQNEKTAAVVRLDQSLSVKDLQGDIVVLELRYVGQKWQRSGTVHLELCDFLPLASPCENRRKGKWIESHATYEILQS